MKNKPSPLVKKLIQLIHIAKSQLRLDEDTYRAMLRTHGGADSSAAMSVAQLERVLQHLSACGFKSITAQGMAGRPANTDSQPQLQKIEALLADQKLPWSYARSIAERMFGKRLEFCEMPEWRAVITALKARQRRQGVAERRADPPGTSGAQALPPPAPAPTVLSGHRVAGGAGE